MNDFRNSLFTMDNNSINYFGYINDNKKDKTKYFPNLNKSFRLKYKNMFNEISLILLGATGDGKSQLGNFILNNPKAFKVSDDIDSETKETRGEYGINGAEDLFVIDTPGLQDTHEKDKLILAQMASYVKKHKILHAIIIVLNFEIDRLSGYIQNMLKIFVKMFPIPNFWDHVAFVFTHYYYEMYQKNPKKMKLKKQKKIERFSELIIELMLKFKNIIEDVQIPKKSNLRFYFVDTEMEDIDNKDLNSVEEINRLVGWAASLETFQTDKIVKVDNKVVGVRFETQTRRIGSTWNKNYEIVHYVKEKRKIEKLYCGKESFNQWVKIGEYCNEIYHDPIIVKTDKKWKKEKSSKFKLNIEYITIKYYYKIISIYNDDTTEESSWIYSHSDSDKIIHPKKLTKSETEYKETYDKQENKAGTIITHYTYMWSRVKKYYNDLSIEYSKWRQINTIKKIERRPPHIIKKVTQTKVKTFYKPIIERKSKEVFDFLLIFFPIYKTVYYDETIGREVIEETYERRVDYYSDGSVNYGNWKYQYENSYNEYY